MTIFLLAAETKEQFQKMLIVLIRLLRDLGFDISWPKVVGPTQRITFLGVDISTKDCTLSLVDDKRWQVQHKLQQFQNKKTRKQAAATKPRRVAEPGVICGTGRKILSPSHSRRNKTFAAAKNTRHAYPKPFKKMCNSGYHSSMCLTELCI